MTQKRKFFQGIDLTGNALDNVGSVKIDADAISSDQAVRKSQAETISATAVQDKIVQSAASASSDNVLSGQYMNSALATKQPNMSIHPDSTDRLELVGGSQIRLKDLGIVSNYKDSSAVTLQAFIDSVTFNGDGTITTGDSQVLDAMTFIFLESATNPSERSFIYRGTNAGDTTDFITFSVDYNQATIRSFFDAAGVGIDYDVSTGLYSLVLGTGSNDLGAQTVPMDQTKFSTVAGSTVEAALVALEALIVQVDATLTGGAATLDTRLTTLSGVSGNNLQSFTEGLFSDNKSIKEVLQESESLHKAAQVDRATIRSEVAAADTVLQSNIDSEASSRALADNQLQTNISAEAASRESADLLLSSSIASETSARQSEDNLIKSRLDVVEGAGVGSVAKAEQDSKDYADAAVLVEKSAREAADVAINQKIDNLQEGDIVFVGEVQTDGSVSIRSARVSAGDTRNGQMLKDMDLSAGEEFIAESDFTVSFNDTSSIVLQAGDKMMCLDDMTSGSATAIKFNVVQANGSALTVANLDDQRIEQKPNGKLDVVADSIGRDQLDSAIEADIDDKQSISQPNTITSDGSTHFVNSSALGAQQNIYWKRTQLGSDPLTGTARTVLGELVVNSDGSGNPAAPSYAHTTTMSSHYQGSCSDSSLVMAGGNFEANAKAGSAIQATGIYAVASQPQDGVNIGLTGYANGAATSNVGVVAFSGTAGVGKDRGMIASVSTTDIVTYSGSRIFDPFPHNDIAGVFDAKYGPSGCYAMYSYGRVHFDHGVVEVEDAPTTDKGVMRLKDIKDKEKCYRMDLTNGVEKSITCSLDLDKCIIQVLDNDEQIEVQVTRDNAGSSIKVKAIGGNLTSVMVLVKELECDVEDV